VGVIPVTTVVTVVSYGPEEEAEIRFLDGSTEEVAVDAIRYFIAESENPGNVKQVSMVTVRLPELNRST